MEVQLHECLHHFVPVRAVHSFLCPDLLFLCVFASKVMHSPREIGGAIHACKVEHVLTSIAPLQMAHLVHRNIRACTGNL